MRPKELVYFLSGTKKLSLNLYEAENYYHAVVVQPLIANLVRYSNNGRYEPFAAESWRTVNDREWEFTVRSDLVCENGEKVTPESFKKSIELSIRKNSKSGPIPVLSTLVGIDGFLAGKKDEIEGLSTSSNVLRFRFNVPVHTGLIQILSFAPFGFICKENRDQMTGEWLNSEKFIASGPYRVEKEDSGEVFQLTLRKEWPVRNKSAPSKVKVTLLLPGERPPISGVPFIYDSIAEPTFKVENATRIHLVPEYLKYVLLSPRGFFSSYENRRAVFDTVVRIRDKKGKPSEYTSIAQFFFHSQKPENALQTDTLKMAFAAPVEPLVMTGPEPLPGQIKYPAWEILRDAFKELGIEYKFDISKTTYSDILNPKHYDFYVGGSAVGGGAEPWGINVLFCSDVGPRMPDPSGRVCKAVSEAVNGQIDESEFVTVFSQSVGEDKAIIPIHHFGLNLFFSQNFNFEKVSPLISVLRFDELEME